MIIDLTPTPAWALFSLLIICIVGAVGLMCLVDWIAHKLDKGK